MLEDGEDTAWTDATCAAGPYSAPRYYETP